MSRDSFPTFSRWLTTFEWSWRWSSEFRSQWKIAPWWKIDTWPAQQRTLLRMLAMAASQKLPIAPLVAQLAEDHCWFYRWRLGKLAQQLSEGKSLPDAIEQTPGILSPEQTLAIRFGAESGTLPAVLQTLVENDGPFSPTGNGSRESSRLHQLGCYIAGMLILATLILGFIFIYIIPSFRQIMYDFAMDEPPAFNLLVGLSNFVTQYWFLLAIAVLIPLWLFYSQRGWRYFHRVWLPRLSRSASRLRGAEILSLLSITEEAGRPLAGAVSTLARYYYDAHIRNKLLFLRNEMEQGADPWQGMREAGLLTAPETNALSTAIDPPARIWTMRKLAEQRRLKVADRLHLMIELLHPLLILLLAGGVFLVAIGAVGPFFHLITALS